MSASLQFVQLVTIWLLVMLKLTPTTSLPLNVTLPAGEMKELEHETVEQAKVVLVRMLITYISNPDVDKNMLTISVMDTFNFISEKKEFFYAVNPDYNTHYTYQLEFTGLQHSTGVVVANDKSYKFDEVSDAEFAYKLRNEDTGTTVANIKMTHHVDCKFNLRNFPFDQHICRVYLKKDTGIVKWLHPDPVHLHPNYGLSEFSIDKLEARECDFNSNNRCLVLEMHLHRLATYYMMSLYGPSSFIVFMGWISFWIDPDAVPARTGIGVTTLLTLMTLSLREHTPSDLTYLTAIDYWNITCQMFAIFAITEFAFVNSLSQHHKHAKNSVSVSGNAQKSPPSKSKLAATDPRHWDRIARVLYPLCFLLFLLIYFAVVLSTKPDPLVTDHEYLKSIHMIDTKLFPNETVTAELRRLTNILEAESHEQD